MTVTETPVRRFLPSALLAVGVLLVFSTRSQTSVPLTGSLATVLPAWQGLRITDQKVSDEEKRIAGMTDYVARVYWKDSADVAFTTYVGYYDRQTQGHSMHSPKNCLPGAGWEILKTDVGTIATAAGGSVLVNKFLLKNGSREAIVYYWYQGRGRVVASEYAVKWNLLHDAALLGHTEEALVRIVAYVPRASTLPAGTTVAQSYTAAEQLGAKVATQLLTDVARVLPASTKQAAGQANQPSPTERILASNSR
jgi:EpsI family protein